MPRIRRRDAAKRLKQTMASPPSTRGAPGPADAAARIRIIEEARRACDAVGPVRWKYPHDPEVRAACDTAAANYQAALDAAYPPGFWEDIARLKAGDPAGLEAGIAFLEDDPYFYRSGYVKEDLVRYLKRMRLSLGDIARLQRIILSAVERHNRREFWAYRRLARKVDSPAFRHALAERLEHDDAAVRRRAHWVLSVFERSPGFQD